MYDNMMMPPDNQFNSSMISGKWIDKRTGRTIEVRDAIQDGENMLLITSDGQLDMMEFTQFYIQASDEIYDKNGNIIGNSEANSLEVTNGYDLYGNTNKSEINQLLHEQGISNKEVSNPQIFDLSKPLDTIETPQISQSSVERIFVEPTKPQLNNFDIINKLFKKIETSPKIDLQIHWTDIPTQEIKTLINYLDVSKEDISAYIYQEYLENSSETLKNQISEYIEQMLVSE